MRGALLLTLLVTLPAVAADLPRQSGLPRVVSTNLCADQLVLRLAAPEQLLSVSAQSQDPQLSSMPELARRFPANHASAEEIIALHPDLVLASRRWLAHNRAELLRSHGIEVLVIPFPTSWADIFANTRLVADKLNRTAEGEALLADAQARLDRLKAQPRPQRALYLRPNGGSAGRDTYVDTVFQAVGLTNHQAALGRVGWGRFDLETLVVNPPDLFVSADMVIDQGYAKSAYARHPRVRELLATHPVLHVTGNRWGCSDLQLVDSAEQLAAQIDALALAGRNHP